ncbi:MAG: DUF4129 domain-containing protein [Saprospiraceae bacterium]|jgi:hypothetical protein|nr:DUF4129 domain-containing protein [Saprospiraceae bacterium]
MPRLFLHLFFSLLALSLAKAQDAEPLPPPPLPSESYVSERIQRHDFDTKKWESLKKGMDYSGPKQQKKKQPKEPLGLQGFAPAFKVLAIGLAIGLLVFLIVKLGSGKDLFGPKDRKLKPTVSEAELDKIEENLHEAELDDPIRRAIAAGDYPLAVRLYYLAMLKELSVRNHIRWKRDKTNGVYLRELAGSPLLGTVQEVTLIFERVWYGKVELTPSDFEQLETKLKAAVATAST